MKKYIVMFENGNTFDFMADRVIQSDHCNIAYKNNMIVALIPFSALLSEAPNQ